MSSWIIGCQICDLTCNFQVTQFYFWSTYDFGQIITRYNCQNLGMIFRNIQSNVNFIFGQFSVDRKLILVVELSGRQASSFKGAPPPPPALPGSVAATHTKLSMTRLTTQAASVMTLCIPQFFEMQYLHEQWSDCSKIVHIGAVSI